MTSQDGNRKWQALTAVSGAISVALIAYNLINSGTNMRIDDLRSDVTADISDVKADIKTVEADVDALQRDMVLVLDALARIEGRQIADDGGTVPAVGSPLASR